MQDQVNDPRPTPLPLRNDTLLGVCEAIGQDFGFNANWLRILFCLGLFVSPMASVGAYLGLGVIVAVARYLAPAPEAELAPRPERAAPAAANSDEAADDRAIAA